MSGTIDTQEALDFARDNLGQYNRWKLQSNQTVDVKRRRRAGRVLFVAFLISSAIAFIVLGYLVNSWFFLGLLPHIIFAMYASAGRDLWDLVALFYLADIVQG